MTEWPFVLWFSATLLLLAVALPVFGRMVGGRSTIGLATIGAAGAALSSIANVIEDGFRVDAAFLAFVGGSLILIVSLLGLTIWIARAAPRATRFLAIVPAGTVTGFLLFVAAGGPILLVTWLAAAVAALRDVPAHTAAPVEASTT